MALEISPETWALAARITQEIEEKRNYEKVMAVYERILPPMEATK